MICENDFNVVVTVCADDEIFVEIDDENLPFNLKGAVKELEKQGWNVRREFTGRVIMEK